LKSAATSATAGASAEQGVNASVTGHGGAVVLGSLGAVWGLRRIRKTASNKQKRQAQSVAMKAVIEEVTKSQPAAEETDASNQAWRGLNLPITRLVGLDDVKLSLRLACIDPSLGGVGICGGHGTAKTTLARSLRGILPRIERMKGSICNLDPEKPREFDPMSRTRFTIGEDGKPETEVVDCPFIELPLGCTEDRLVGSLDVSASMEAGKPIFEPGLLAKAHRGILYIDDVNLLQDDLISLLLTAVESGVNRVEREGLSITHPCRPLIVATWNPEEGELRPHLLDRLAIFQNTDNQSVYTDLQERVIAVTSTLEFADRGMEAYKETEQETASMATQLLFAREFLSDVEVTDDQLQRFAQESSRGVCEGHRAEVFAAKIARAHAALNGRDRCDADDVKMGIKLAIIPRMRVQQANEDEEEMEEPPPPPPPPPPPQEDEQEEDQDQDEEQEQEPEEEDEDEKEEEEEENEDEDDEDQDMEELPEEFMIDAEGAIVDEDLMTFQNQKKKSGSSGARQKIYSMDRGRYVKAMLPKGGDSKTGRIALDATLRTAVVYQKMRRADADEKVAAGKMTEEEKKTVYVEKSDIWIKKMCRKSGALVIFIVDASGSMALNRMQNAKGAVLKLLESAYQSRDQVALIPCRGITAEVLVPPTSSVARASRSMQVLPCGGGTPLAHALKQAMTIGGNAMKTGDTGQVCVVAITDGRANVPLNVSEGEDMPLDENGRMKKVAKEVLQEEVFVLADQLRNMGFKFLLIDTENKYVSSGIAKKVADRADGRYYYLPNAEQASIANIAREAVEEMKAR